MDLKKLKEPFPASDVEWRIQRSGEKNGKVWAMCLSYITSRAVMDRLDAVVGVESWKNEFKEGPHGGVLCGISIKLDGEWVTKWDGADNTDIEAVKGGLSGAMKRAAVLWGIGRYLYDLDVGFANVCDNGQYRAVTKEKKHFKWNPPALPKWALPSSESSNGRTSGLDPDNGGSTPPSETKQDDGWWDYLKAMGEQKVRLGPEVYYMTLGFFNYKKATDLQGKPKEEWAKVYKALEAVEVQDGK